MYAIGTFSKLVGISVKTLHYYHEVGVFKPSYIDPKTNYRYYSFNKFSEIEKIKLFKSFGLPLLDIKLLLENDSITNKQLLLNHKRDLIEEKIKIENQLSLIDELVKNEKIKTKTRNSYTVSHVKYEERKQRIVLNIREQIDLNKINLLIKKLFEKAYAYNLKLIGNLMASITIGEHLSDVEVMMEICETNLTNLNLTNFKVIEEGQYAYLYFKGLYSDLNIAYQKLNKHVKSNNFLIEEFMEGLVPTNFGNPLLIRPNLKKHPETFLTKLQVKI